MNELWNSLLGSFNNAPDGASGKKLTALVSTIFCFVAPVLTWTYWAFKHNDFSLLTTVLTIGSSFILLLFGINSYDKLQNKSEQKEDNKEQE